MYKVLKSFTDLQDNNFKYNEGDVYPRKGYTPTPERITALESGKNKRNTVLIEEIPEIDEKQPEIEEIEGEADKYEGKGQKAHTKANKGK